MDESKTWLNGQLSKVQNFIFICEHFSLMSSETSAFSRNGNYFVPKQDIRVPKS